MLGKTLIQSIALGLTAVLFFVVAPVWATGQDANTVMVQGVQVAIDPATGRVVAPTDAQRQALSAAMAGKVRNTSFNAAQMRPSTEADALKTLKRSSTGRYSAAMQLPESLVSSLVAETKADGSIAIHHQGEAAPAEVTQ